MPNWCDNTLIVTGKRDRLKEFKSLVAKKENDGDVMYFQGIIPCPEELEKSFSGWSGQKDEQEKIEKKQEELLKKYGFKDWYDWRIHNWGTKWNGQLYDCTLDDDQLILSFSSAWSPPIEWLEKVAPKFPKLKFELTFMETGCFFAGKCVAEGESFNNEYGEPMQTDDSGDEVVYNSEKERYVYVHSGEVIDDENFIPLDSNPFE